MGSFCGGKVFGGGCFNVGVSMAFRWFLVALAGGGLASFFLTSMLTVVLRITSGVFILALFFLAALVLI